MRSLFVVVGVLVVLLVLVSSGSITGQLCVRNVGCLRGDDAGFRLDRATEPASTGAGTRARP